MSTDNTETVRRYCALLAAPAAAPAVVDEFWDEDCDYYPVRKFPEARPCHGRQELSSFLTGYLEAFSIYEWAVQDLVAVGDDRVLAHINVRAEGRGSGVELEGGLYQCFWLRHGRFFRVEDHLTSKGALRALGLEGETLEAARLRSSQ
jgi:SnoaL-like domain